jgi:glycosyltransferase involved in cell wall biosynthesis
MTAHSDLSIVAIIPLYNGARWIEQAIASVLSQTQRPDEFIIVDDGSTDDGAGAAIVERMAREHPTIRLLRKPNGGQSSARNFGVAHSNSALIAFLDQDDIWYPRHLETLVAPFRAPRGVLLGWAYSNLDEIDESGGMVNKRLLDLIRGEHPKRRLHTCLSQDLFILPSASLVSRRAFEAVGGFDERLCGYEDDDLFLRLFRAGYDNIYINEPLSKWRLYPTSTSFTRRMAKSQMVYAQKLFEQFPDNPRQRTYLSRDCIAPRFAHAIMGGFLTRALEQYDQEMFRISVAHLRLLLPHLSARRRLILSIALMLFGQFDVALTMYKARGLTRSVAKKLLLA